MISTLISYSREDSEFASRLAADLRAAGTRVAMAPLDGGPDARSHNAVESALAQCSDWLVVLSPNAVHSASFGLDAAAAVAVGREIPIAAILRRDCEVPARLQHVTIVDFRTDYAAGLRQLLAKVASTQSRLADSHTALYVPPGRANGGPASPHLKTDGRRATSAELQPRRAGESPPESLPDAKKSAGASHSGRLLRLLGSTLLAIAIIGFLGVMILTRSALDSATAWATAVIGLLIVFLPALAGVKLLKRGKQSGVLSAAAALAHDARAPVVYLRSFQDDSVASEGSLSPSMLGGGALVGGLMSLLNLAGGVASEEEQLAEALQAVGPFVAVGKPGEKLPELGAARMYVKDSEWQGVVRGLMSRAGLVVLRAGRTEGLWWEVQTAAESVRPERIVFVLPYDREQYEQFRSRAAAIFRHRLPDYPAGKKQGSAGSVQGIIYFEPDWTPHFGQPDGFYQTPKAWLPAFKRMFQPVFKQLGIEVKLPKRSVWKVLLLIVLAPIAAIVAMFFVMGLIGALMRIVGN